MSAPGPDCVNGTTGGPPCATAVRALSVCSPSVCSPSACAPAPPAARARRSATGRRSRHTGGVALTDFNDPVIWLVDTALFVLALWALVDAAVRPAAAFPAAGKLTKPAWVAILAVCVLLCVAGVGIFGLLGIIVAVAVLVYLLDVRPAVRELRPGGPWG